MAWQNRRSLVESTCAMTHIAVDRVGRASSRVTRKTREGRRSGTAGSHGSASGWWK